MSYTDMDLQGTGEPDFEIGGVANSWSTSTNPPILLNTALIAAESTAELSEGARIKEIIFVVTTGYDNNSQLASRIEGTTNLNLPTLPAAQAATPGVYKYSTGWTVGSGENGPLVVTPSDTPTVGACQVFLYYDDAPAE